MPPLSTASDSRWSFSSSVPRLTTFTSKTWKHWWNDDKVDEMTIIKESSAIVTHTTKEKFEDNHETAELNVGQVWNLHHFQILLKQTTTVLVL
jgi:hypothetical protein